ncbi:MAG: hypothetical protein NVSMB68_06560 [Thermoanaerobaculia bacterium]
MKHFAYIERGKQRIHRTPRQIEVTACRPWLDAELRLLSPQLVVCLGATAAKALLGAAFRVTADHGRMFTTRSGLRVIATLHPSAVLRAGEESENYFATIVTDLRTASSFLSVPA